MLTKSLLLSAAFTLTLAPMAAKAEEVVVFAAASLKTALDQAAERFTAENGAKVVISYAGSNQLAQQIIAGAPADIFLSAAENWMDSVEKEGLVAEGGRKDLWGNRLVLVGAAANPASVELDKGFDLAGLLDGGKLAMGMVDAVPAGQYGKEALQALDMWEQVEASVAQSDNVRAALALVALGEAPYAITYSTDAQAEPAVRVVGTFPASSHRPIRYPGALLASASDAADLAFFEALRQPDYAAIFEAEGFEILP